MFHMITKIICDDNELKIEYSWSFFSGYSLFSYIWLCFRINSFVFLGDMWYKHSILQQFQQTRGSTLKKSVGSLESQARKLKMQIWSGIVNIVLVEGHDLMAMDDNGLSDPYVKFRLGQEKYKSKVRQLNKAWKYILCMYLNAE